MQNVEIWWQGYGGLVLVDVRKKIRTLCQVNSNKPSFIILHCGGNDLGKLDLKAFRSLLPLIFKLIEEIIPGTKIIWSEILPRQNWRYSKNNKAMDIARRRMNSFGGKFAIENQGAYLRHPLLDKFCEKYFSKDGVHLNSLGNTILLNQISKGISEFMNGKDYIC